MKYTKNGITVSVGGTVVENGISYVGVTKSWLLNNGWSEVVIEKIKKPEEDLLLKAKENKINEIDFIDNSSFVNEFYYNEIPMWFDKATRVGLVNAINSAKLLEQPIVTLGFGSMSIELPCDLASKMLAQLELYALRCYNVTLNHKNTILELNSIEDINNFDVTSGYPDKLYFNNE